MRSRRSRSPRLIGGADPDGLGDGARNFARELRLQLMREHLDLGDGADDELLLDSDRAAQTVRHRAEELDAWHACGARTASTRPAAPPRAGIPRRQARRLDLLAYHPAYRVFLDPDGRPLGMRLRRSY